MEVFRFGVSSRLHLHDDRVIFPGRQRGFGYKEIPFLIKFQFGFAGRSFGGDRHQFGSGGLCFYGRIIKGDADGAASFHKELGVFGFHFEHAAFARTGFDLVMGQRGRDGNS